MRGSRKLFFHGGGGGGPTIRIRYMSHSTKVKEFELKNFAKNNTTNLDFFFVFISTLNN